jgi:hypothetical protein
VKRLADWLVPRSALQWRWLTGPPRWRGRNPAVIVVHHVLADRDVEQLRRRWEARPSSPRCVP